MPWMLLTQNVPLNVMIYQNSGENTQRNPGKRAERERAVLWCVVYESACVRLREYNTVM